MIEMPDYANPISLIPGGCPQMLDYAAPLESVAKVRYGFTEVPEKGPDGQNRYRLKAYRRNEDGDFVDEADMQSVANNFSYGVNAEKAIKPWLGQWLPLPFLRVREQTWADSGDCRFEYGPSNWARGRLTRTPAGDLRLVIAFDMQVEDRQADIYPALTRADVEANAHFRLAWRFRDNSWFMDLPWVDEWLKDVWLQSRGKKRQDDEFQLEYLAAYLTFLEVIQIVGRQCEVYVVRPDGGCVDVDLILDIGNSRTTGILVETFAQSVTSLENSYLLQLRDMDEPENIYVDPFETRVEFSEISFGNDALSMRSGRRTPAYNWPSPVRIGPEAARLATMCRCEKGSTGMSSPKRYLWDERNWQRTWRFNTKSDKAPYVTRGPLAQRINSSGTPLCCMEDREFGRNRILRSQERESAFESLFTRSSLMMFLLVEIVQQALLTINAPGQRLRRELSARPRRLRQVIFTIPGGMPMAERNIYRRWGVWAVHVLWEALGWGQFYLGNERRNMRSPLNDYRMSPIVRCDWDEATCTQLVYVYNEIVNKFQGDAQTFCELAGHQRKFGDHEAPSVRVAAIDIGGGTTDLSITTFELVSARSATPRLEAHPEFHDGFNLAGDDILRAVVANHVMAAIGEAMKQAGVPDAQLALTALFGRATLDASMADLNSRIQFVRQVAAPVGLCVLELYENADLTQGSARINFSFGDCFLDENGNAPEGPIKKRFPRPGAQALDYLRKYMASKWHVEDFDALAIPIGVSGAQVDGTVRGVLKDVLANLCQVINLYDTDVLLLTGRPSCWPGVVDSIASHLPVPPSRIYPMNEYHVGAWYPFANTLGRISDPKTTVVTGAKLCALAEGQLEGFSFDPRSLGLVSTARHIGEMELTGQILKEKVWFDVDPEAGTVRPEQRDVTFTGPISVGFRQLNAERWTTTRFYTLDYVNSQDPVLGTLRFPLTVRLKLHLPEDDDDERDEGEFEIEEILDANNENPRGKLLEMRLQTLPRDEGFWLDTGTIYDN